MIDTIKIFTGLYDIKSVNSLLTQIKTDSQGQILDQKKYCNLPDLNIDITSDNTLYVTTSLPKMLYKTSLIEVKESDIDRSIEGIEKGLESAGIVIDSNGLKDFDLSRLDYCKNIKVDHSPMDYLMTLSNYGLSRRDRREIHKETVYFRNKSQELVFYNKVKEVRDKERNLDILSLIKNRPEDILRIESKLKKKRVIERELKIESPKLTEVFNFEHARKKLLKDLDNLVSTGDIQLEFNFKQNSDLLKYFENKYDRGAFKMFLAVKGATRFFHEFQYDWDKIKEFLYSHYSKATVYRIVKELREFQSIVIETEERDLLGELRQKLAV